MVDQCVYKRATGCARCRMDNHARRLIHNDQVIIFEDNIQRNVFTNDMAFLGHGDLNSDQCILGHAKPRVVDHDAINRNSALCN